MGRLCVCVEGGGEEGVGGELKDYPRELNNFDKFMSNSLPLNFKFVSKIPWVGFRFFIYSPEEFPAQVSVFQWPVKFLH